MKTTVNNCGFKNIRKSVNVTDINGMQYITIYEVCGVKSDGQVITLDRYLSEKDSECHVAFANEHYKHLYPSIFIREQWVWC